MNGKRLAAMLLTGMLITAVLYWGSHMDRASTVTVGDPEVGVIETDGALALGESGGEIISTGDDTGPDGLFAVYAYYNPEYLDRYTRYALEAPELDSETVVWHVNAGLDTAPYTLTSEARGAQPLLVNKHYKLPDGYEPEELVVIHSGIMATPGTAEAFRRMRAAAMRDGVYIEAAVGFRSIGKQAELFEAEERYCGTQAAEESVARPGFGEHSTGRALHIVDRDYNFEGFDKTPEYAWLTGHCADYGFILRYGSGASGITGFAYEPYHFTFVGADIARDMAELSISTLEEYAARDLAPPEYEPIDDRVAVVIVPGYGGGADNQYEAGIALRIRERLEEEDVRVVVTRDSGEIEKESKATTLIGLDRGGASSGAVAWFASDGPESRSLAETMCGRLSWSSVNAESRGINDDDKIAVISLTDAPAVLVELSDTYDQSPAGAEQLAKSISDAIIARLGIRRMYLTFDDGPSAKNTPKVLDILKEKGVKATFFVIGEMAEENPELLKRIAAEGHAIGIHCNSHDYRELYSSVESFTEDFEKARDTVREITGLEPVIYRFPGGSVNTYNTEVYEGIIKEMNALGYIYFDWNISTDDALGRVEAGQLMKNVREYPRPRHAVLLMHDAYANIVEELADLIDHYSDYQMDVIDADTESVQF